MSDRIELEIAEVRPEDCSVVFEESHNFDEAAPVLINGIPRKVIASDSDQLWLDSIEQISQDDVCVQETIFSSDREIIQQLRETWEPRWNRAHHVQPGQWEQITGFIQQALRPIEWSFREWTGPLVKQLAQSKKAKAGVGPDGVSRHDIISLPVKGVESLASMFRAVESGKRWPQQLTCGFVSSLAKTRTATLPDHYRPVTIYSLVYRLWSTLRSREALRSLEKILPVSVQGGCPNRQSRSLWYALCVQLEHCQKHAIPMVGLTLDLQKAFNALPRVPIWECLKQLGMPIEIVRAWGHFTHQQSRRFRVRQSVSEPIFSVTGLAEGCGMSVFGMTVIDYLLDLWLQAGMPSVRLGTFVDDWQLQTDQPDQLNQAWDLLQQFTDMMDLTIDARKTFAWSALQPERKTLRLGKWKVELASKMLGIHHNFSRKAGNRTLQNRVAGMEDTWTRLRMSSSPIKHKVTALQVMGWTKALHGISVVHLGKQHFKTLRSGAMKGMRTNRKGTNPVLHLATYRLQVDPECWAVLQTFRDAREYADNDSFRADLSAYACRSKTSNGPIGVLVKRAERIGWTLQNDGRFQDQIGPFDALTCAWDELVVRMRLSWPSVLAAEVCHRSSLEGIQHADLGEIAGTLRTLGDDHQALLRCHLDGTLYTTNGRAHFEEGRSNQCPWCNQKDGFYHRAWECDFFKPDRADVPEEILQLMPMMPSCLTCHAWPVKAEGLQELYQALCCIPQISSFPILPQRLHAYQIFVDGSCIHGDAIPIRLASWAVTLAGSDQSHFHHKILAAGQVRGLIQTAYRGELQAMLTAISIAIQSRVHVVIWCDNESVVKGVRRILRGDFRRKAIRTHGDLWDTIHNLLGQADHNQIQVVKVTSHCDLEQAKDETERWAFFHNSLVDHAASQANQLRPTAFWMIWERAKLGVQKSRDIHKHVVKVHLKTAERAIAHEPKASEQPNQPGPVRAPEEHDASEAEPSPSGWEIPEGLATKVGKTTVTQIHRWWTATGVTAIRRRERVVWLSGLQLLVDYLLSWGTVGPLYFGRRWVDDQVADTDAAFHGQTTFQRIHAFLHVLRLYCARNGMTIPCKYRKGNGSAIAMRLNCYRVAWPPERLHVVDDAIMSTLGRVVRKVADINELGRFPIHTRMVLD